MENKNKDIGLAIYVDNYDDSKKENYTNAAYQIVDGILGEKIAAKSIKYLEARNLPENQDVIRVSKLHEYIKWSISKKNSQLNTE